MKMMDEGIFLSILSNNESIIVAWTIAIML